MKLTSQSAIAILPLTKSDDDDTRVGGQFRLADMQFALSQSGTSVATTNARRESSAAGVTPWLWR